MGLVQVDYATVKNECPEAFAEIVAKLKRSAAKSIQGVAADQLGWSYYYSEYVDGFDRRALSASLRAELRIANATACVRADYGQWHVGSYKVIGIPLAIRNEIHRQEIQREEEQKRIALLSPEQREAELKELLGKFFKGGGIAVSIGKED